MKCSRCYGKGKPGGCPKCGVDSDTVISNNKPEIDTVVQLTNLIPSFYKGKYWEPNENEKNLTIRNVEKGMQKIHSCCVDGKIPSFSAFISGPLRLDKELFVYSCLQLLLVRGFKLAPFLSTIEMRRLIRTSQYNPKYKLFSKWTYDDVISSDILFITVTHLTEDRHTDITLIQEVLDIRSRMDKPTVFLSDYKLESLVSRYDSQEYLLIYNASPIRDKLRYPYILQSIDNEEEEV